MTNFSPFNELGLIRRDFTETEIESLDDNARPKFFALVEAATNAEACEDQLRADTDAMHAAAAAAQTARETLENVLPKITFLEALRAVQNRPKEY